VTDMYVNVLHKRIQILTMRHFYELRRFYDDIYHHIFHSRL